MDPRASSPDATTSGRPAPEAVTRPTPDEPPAAQTRVVELDEQERQLCARLAEPIKLEVVMALAGRSQEIPAARGYGAAVEAFVRSRSADEQVALRRAAVELLDQSEAMRRRTLGGLASLRPEHHEASIAAGKAELLRMIERHRAAAAPSMPPLVGGPTYSNVSFRLLSVRCLEETDGELGSDEILLGGVAVGPFGDKAKIPSFKVSDDFDQGEQVVYPPLFPPGHFDPSDPTKGKTLATFELLNHGAKGWPGRTYALTLLMGEQDSGGFGQLVNDVWDEVGDELAAEVGSAVSQWIGGWLGAVVGAVVSGVITFIGSLLGDNADDFIAQKTFELKLSFPFVASFATPQAKAAQETKAPAEVYAAKPTKLTFKGDGGRYEVVLSWRVHH